SERSTEALALTRSQLRENFSNMACLRWMVRILPGARGARNAGMQVEDAAGGADVTDKDAGTASLRADTPATGTTAGAPAAPAGGAQPSATRSKATSWSGCAAHSAAMVSCKTGWRA